MEPSARAPWYDLFKLLVAIILLILFLLLTWRQAPQSATPLSESPTEAVPPTIAPVASSSLTLTVAVNSTSSSQATLAPIRTPTTTIPISSPAGTNTPPPATTLTPLPSPTLTPVSESTATSIAAIPATLDVCEAASSRSRLQVGRSATILRRLNFRSSPGIRDNWLLTNIPGTRAEVVGGPECIPHSIGAYLWWQVKLPNGQIGWSAEASVLGAFYFMEPVK